MVHGVRLKCDRNLFGFIGNTSGRDDPKNAISMVMFFQFHCSCDVDAAGRRQHSGAILFGCTVVFLAGCGTMFICAWGRLREPVLPSFPKPLRMLVHRIHVLSLSFCCAMCETV